MFNKEFIAYVPINEVPNLYDRDVKMFTRINLAFAVLKDNKAYIRDESYLENLNSLKEINPQLKIVLSVGGAGAFGFSIMANDKDSRIEFIDSLIDLIDKYNLDGIDLDWEFPTRDFGGDFAEYDRENFTILLKEIRERLDDKGEYLLSIAAGVGEWFVGSVELEKIPNYLDDILLMTYDLRGFGQEFTGLHTTLYTKKEDIIQMSASDGVELLVKNGVPKEKIVIGFGQYSRFWEGVESNNDGLLQKAAPNGGEHGPHYPKLQYEVIDNPLFENYYDEEAESPYSYSKELKIFHSYDNSRSVKAKASYVMDQNLKGLMFWRYVDWKENPLMLEMYKLIEGK